MGKDTRSLQARDDDDVVERIEQQKLDAHLDQIDDDQRAHIEEEAEADAFLRSLTLGGAGKFFLSLVGLRPRRRLVFPKSKEFIGNGVMTKKPGLSLVSKTIPDPPVTLGRTGADLWARVQSEYAIVDSGGVELLAQACLAADRAQRLADQITADGEIVHTRNGPRAHPGLRDELACRAFICRTITRLGLNVEGIKPLGRPGSPIGITWQQTRE